MAVRPVHVSKFQVGSGGTAPSTERNEGAVVALFPRRERLEARRGGGLTAALIPVYVTGRVLCVAGKARAGVQRAVGADGVRVLAMDLTRTHVDAIDGVESALLRLLAEKR